MNLEEFNTLYSKLGQKNKVEITCKCGRKKTINKEKALRNIINHGEYICRSCSMTESHKNNPVSETTKQKQREGRLGKKHSQETKDLIAQRKKELYQSPEGQIIKRKLSESTSKQHSSTKMDKHKRKIFYISAKNNGEIRVCNSSYEFIACEYFLEKNDDVKSYETQVPYEIDGKHRSLDFLITYIDGTKKAIEVKPKKRVNEDQQKQQLIDSAENADRKSYEFEIWTEDDLKITKCKDATKLADEYRLKNHLIDYASYRNEKRKASTKRHSDKTSLDRVIIYCSFCKKYHSRSRKKYEENVKKHSRFICIRENGSIVGHRPKPHLRNPLEAENKKECPVCKRILTIEGNFSPNGVDKNGKQKWCSHCKECRAKKYKDKYNNEK